MGRKITAAQVAAEAGVSAATVDRVLNARGGVTPDKETAVLAAARKLGLDRALNQRAARTLRVAVLCQPPRNPFHAEVARQFEAATRIWPQFNLQFRIQHIDPVTPAQTAARIAALADQSDAMVILSGHEPQIAAALAAFEATGKPVIALATDIGGGIGRYIGPDNHQAGRMAGDLMGRFLAGGDADVLVIAGLLSMIGHAERVRGFQAVLAERYPRLRVCDVVESGESAERAGDLVHLALRANPQIRGIYNASAGAQPVVAARERLGRSRDVAFITHELTPDRSALLRQGAIDAVLDQTPEHEVKVAVQTLAATFGRAEAFPESFITPVHIHMIENA
ncbi:MAG: LacI family DNA-binding transcriptional regulator [Paracoccaceae bacterium]|nr:LacI family DNA-binding transcriptional regulator [Paracoccaceae bacterium]